MRTALLVLASGLALSFAVPAFAEETVPDAQRFSAPQPASATQTENTKYCRHMIHEGALNVQHCRSAKSWELTRLQTQQTITEFQHHSYVLPMKR